MIKRKGGTSPNAFLKFDKLGREAIKLEGEVSSGDALFDPKPLFITKTESYKGIC